jgi:tape measure domain-containing protein
VIVKELQTLLSFRTDGRGAQEYDQQLTRLRNAAAAAAAAIAAAFGVDRLIKAGDDYTTAMNRLGASTTGPEQAAAAYEQLYTSARETGVAVVESTRAFMRFNPAMAKLGYSLEDTTTLVDGIQRGLLAAGSSAAEASNIFVQLGQAVNANNFSGDELKSFLENSSPTLLNAMAEAIGVTADKLKEMGSEGKLTNKNVLPALLAAARAGRDEFGRMRVTVELSMARSRVALDRFLAEFDRGFQVTEKLGKLIGRVGADFDRWRTRIPIVREWVDSLGGLERILASVALGIVYVTSVQAAMNGVLSATIARIAILTAGFAAAVAAGLLLHDFFTWMSGSDTKTLFGRMFGPFDQAIGTLAPGLETLKERLLDIKTMLIGTPDEAQAAWLRLKETVRNIWTDVRKDWPDWANWAFDRTVDASVSVGSAVGPVVQSAGPAVAQAYREDSPGPVLGWFEERLRDILGGIGFRQRVEQPDGSMRLLAPGENMNQAILGSMAPRSNNVTATQNNTINLGGVIVNATGVSGSEVAAGTQAGVSRAADSLRPIEGELARRLRTAIPGVEGGGGVGVDAP